jgi:hypothetical protein
MIPGMSSQRLPPDPTLIHNVAWDLEQLRAFGSCVWTEDELRDESVRLRRLLVMGQLALAWSQLGFPRGFRITAPHLDPEDLANVKWAVASRAATSGGPVSWSGITWSESKGPRRTWAETNIAAMRRHERWKANGEGSRCYSLDDYLASTGIIFCGQLISRIRVIDYVANRQGTAHYDTNRQGAKGREFVLLDEASIVSVDHLPAIYNELWAMGQSLARAGDARRFIRSAVPYRKRNPETIFVCPARSSA